MSGDDASLDACEERLGVRFQDRDLLRAALTHASSKSLQGRSNERMEFLGDAVLQLAVSERLFRSRPDLEEGEMTKARAQTVNRRTLAAAARALALERFVIVGRMFESPASVVESVLADAMEAVIAAVYLDAGFDAARDFVLARVGGDLDRAVEAPGAKDWKSLFSRFAQESGRATPTYAVLSVAGPDHELTFEVAALYDGRRFGPCYGRSKKEAEQRAARAALRALGAPGA
ncbi:MAG TPA: ribonuclease III [Planctomycetota bacterium]|nr:ribonuclease III [Planctomycetota bacterium]